jgi:hypothetical protein
MKTLLCALLLLGGVARAEPPPAARLKLPTLPTLDDSLAPVRMDPALLDRAYRNAHFKRDLGIAIAAPGVALTVIGSLLIGLAAPNPNLLDSGREYANGIISCAVGVVLSAPGTALWIIGQDDMDLAVWRKRQLLELGGRF